MQSDDASEIAGWLASIEDILRQAPEDAYGRGTELGASSVRDVAASRDSGERMSLGSDASSRERQQSSTPGRVSRSSRLSNLMSRPTSWRHSRSSSIEAESQAAAAVAAVATRVASKAGADSPREVEGDRNMQGWVWKPASLAKGQWRRRWCELRGSQLWQRDSNTAQASAAGKLLIDVGGLLVQEVCPPHPRATPPPLSVGLARDGSTRRARARVYTLAGGPEPHDAHDAAPFRHLHPP